MDGPETTAKTVEYTERCQEHYGVQTGITKILEILEKQETRLEKGDERFTQIQEFMIKKDLTNGYTAEDIQEFRENKDNLEKRITDLEKNTATKNELLRVEEKLPSKFMIYINTLIIALFVFAVLFDAARNAHIFKLLGL